MTVALVFGNMGDKMRLRYKQTHDDITCDCYENIQDLIMGSRARGVVYNRVLMLSTAVKDEIFQTDYLADYIRANASTVFVLVARQNIDVDVATKFVKSVNSSFVIAMMIGGATQVVLEDALTLPPDVLNARYGIRHEVEVSIETEDIVHEEPRVEQPQEQKKKKGFFSRLKEKNEQAKAELARRNENRKISENLQETNQTESLDNTTEATSVNMQGENSGFVSNEVGSDYSEVPQYSDETPIVDDYSMNQLAENTFEGEENQEFTDTTPSSDGYTDFGADSTDFGVDFSESNTPVSDTAMEDGWSFGEDTNDSDSEDTQEEQGIASDESDFMGAMGDFDPNDFAIPNDTDDFDYGNSEEPQEEESADDFAGMSFGTPMEEQGMFASDEDSDEDSDDEDDFADFQMPDFGTFAEDMKIGDDDFYAEENTFTEEDDTTFPSVDMADPEEQVEVPDIPTIPDFTDMSRPVSTPSEPVDERYQYDEEKHNTGAFAGVLNQNEVVETEDFDLSLGADAFEDEETAEEPIAEEPVVENNFVTEESPVVAEPTPPVQPQGRPAKKEKQKKSGGLFGSLFGGKGKNNQSTEEPVEETSVEETPVEETVEESPVVNTSAHKVPKRMRTAEPEEPEAEEPVKVVPQRNTEPVQPRNLPTVRPVAEVAEVDDSLLDDINDIVGDIDTEYRQEEVAQNTRIVERVVEREVVKEVTVHGSSKSVLGSIYKGKAKKILLVTGAAGSGVTTLAWDLAMFFAKSCSVLYVDGNTDNHGLLNYVDYERICDYEDTQLQGIRLCRNAKAFSRCCIRFDRNLDLLISDFFVEVTDEQYEDMQSAITDIAREYSIVILDIPMSKLHLCEEVLSASNLIMTAELSKRGAMNLCCEFDKSKLRPKYKRTIVSRGTLVLTKCEGKKFTIKDLKKYVESVVDFDDDDPNWLTMKSINREKTIKDKFVEEVLEG